MLEEICGELALKNVVLVSTRWSEVDEKTGAQREQQLRDEFWAYMLGHGATLARFTGQRASAMGIASQLVSRRDIVLDLQWELVEESEQLKQTVAGSYVQDDFSEKKQQLQKEMQDLENLRQTLQENDRALRRKVQDDWTREQQRLQIADKDEKRLRKRIAAEVRVEIEGEKEKKGSKLWKMIPLLPSFLGIIEMLCGIPPGSKEH